jgi:hypothetical protein
MTVTNVPRGTFSLREFSERRRRDRKSPACECWVNVVGKPSPGGTTYLFHFVERPPTTSHRRTKGKKHLTWSNRDKPDTDKTFTPISASLRRHFHYRLRTHNDSNHSIRKRRQTLKTWEGPVCHYILAPCFIRGDKSCPIAYRPCCFVI